MIRKCTLLTSGLLAIGLLASRPTMAQQQAQLAKFQKGTLEKGQKVGIWQYYGYTTTNVLTVVQVYDHSNNKLLYYRPMAPTSYRAEVKPGEWRYMLPDQPPMFIGGSESLGVYVSQLVYPPEAQERMLQGKVVVSFQIDTLGRVSNYHLTQRIGRLCDEEAMRVAHLIPTTWVPARIGSHAVAVEYELPFTFRMGAR